MDKDEVLSGLLQELKRGSIVLGVLSQLKTPMYGYNLVTRLAERGMAVESNTMYPLLRRLESQGILSSQWDVGEGKPRKYYVRTAEGTKIYEILSRQWKKNAACMEKLLEESGMPQQEKG